MVILEVVISIVIATGHVNLVHGLTDHTALPRSSALGQLSQNVSISIRKACTTLTVIIIIMNTILFSIPLT